MPTNGQLMSMQPEDRAKAIASLSTEVRLRLAELAAQGLRRHTNEAARLAETLVALTKNYPKEQGASK